MGVGGKHHALALYPQGKRPGTYSIKGSVGPRARVDECVKSRPPPRFNPRTNQPIASCYKDSVTFLFFTFLQM
jgi:hypothetical protein